MDIKQRIMQALETMDYRWYCAPEYVRICHEAFAEIERLEAAAKHNPYKVNLRDAPAMSFREMNQFGDSFTDTQRIERIERFLNEFIASNR